MADTSSQHGQHPGRTDMPFDGNCHLEVTFLRKTGLFPPSNGHILLQKIEFPDL
jgi:hypothetical protein